MIQILKPSVSKQKEGDFSTSFIFEPLERGFGYTFGNSLRRVLMSSLPGAAVTSVKIEGVQHEFSTIKGVKEDVVDILLNIKNLVLKSHSEEPVTIKLSAKGPKEVTAADIKAPADVEIVNPSLYICSINKTGSINMEMTVEKGRGYSTAEKNKTPNMPIGTITVDSVFSPVKKASYKVENTRVGQRTDFNKMTLTLETNGSMAPEDALSQAANIINEHLELLIEEATATEQSIFVAAETPSTQMLNQPIEDLDLSVRSYNCLKKAGVDTLGQLTQTKKEDLMSIRNFGQKSIDEIEDKLKELGLELGGNA
ncbi:MAG: DNA-directed RNA polymerase subunit alpha [Actinobacteria bacterium]|nr:MAG: DNA-directed RNA polymerase subunit alpha [Actinomycetota bacterium]